MMGLVCVDWDFHWLLRSLVFGTSVNVYEYKIGSRLVVYASVGFCFTQYVTSNVIRRLWLDFGQLLDLIMVCVIVHIPQRSYMYYYSYPHRNARIVLQNCALFKHGEKK